MRSKAACLARLKKLKSRVSESFLEMGEICQIVLENKWYSPYASFRDFVESELGIHYRKAMYLIDIARLVRDGSMSRKDALDMGWSKASKIAGWDPDSDQFKYVVANHRSLSQDAVVAMKNGDTQRIMDGVRRTFTFTWPELDELDTSMQLVGYTAYARDSGTTKEAALLILVRAGASVLAKKRKKSRLKCEINCIPAGK